MLRGRRKEYLRRGSANWGSRWEGEFADRERREKSAGGNEVSDHGSGSEKVKGHVPRRASIDPDLRAGLVPRPYADRHSMDGGRSSRGKRR